MAKPGYGVLLDAPAVDQPTRAEIAQVKATNFVTVVPVAKGDTYEKIAMACGVTAATIRAFPLTRLLQGTSNDPLDPPRTPLPPSWGWVVVPWSRHKLMKVFVGYGRLREVNYKRYFTDAQLTYKELTADLDTNLLYLDLVAMAATLPISLGGMAWEASTARAAAAGDRVGRFADFALKATQWTSSRGVIAPMLTKMISDPKTVNSVVFLIDQAANVLARASTLAPSNARGAPLRAAFTVDKPAHFPKPKEPDKGFWFYLRHGTGAFNPSWWGQVVQGYRDLDPDLIMHGTEAWKRRAVETLRAGAIRRDWEMIRRRKEIASQINQPYYYG